MIYLGGNITSNTSPICINDMEGNVLNGKNIVEVAAGYAVTTALDNQGKIYTWGNNTFGELGDETANNSSVPLCISELEGNTLNGKKIVSITSNYGLSIAIDNEGKIYIWGFMITAQTPINVPTCINDIAGNILNEKNIEKIYFGTCHLIIINKTGEISIIGRVDASE